MRYPTRAFQSDTTVVSNDRRHPHHVSQTKAAPANPSGRLSPTLLTKPPTYQVPESRVISRSPDLQRCKSSHVMSSKVRLNLVSFLSYLAASPDPSRGPR